MSESDLWTELNGIMGKKWHASRVESHSTSAGIPDVDYCYMGDGHVELKFSNSMAVPDIRESQVRWLMKRSAHGGRCYILTKLVWAKEAPTYLWHRGENVMTLRSNRTFGYWLNTRINHYYQELNPSETQFLLAGERQ